MEYKIMFAGAILLGGWLLFYLFGRQLLFNFFTAYPVVRKMRSIDQSLISENADKYTTVSVVTCALIVLLFLFIVLRFCPLYLIICFFIGFVICLVMALPKLKPTEKSNFEMFCVSYYRFVADDELRTAMYNKKISQMKTRLHDMNLSTDFIPNFK